MRQEEQRDLATLTRRFESLPDDPDDSSWWFFEETAFLIAETGAPGCAYLMTALDGDDDQRVAAAASALGTRSCDSAVVRARLVQLLGEKRWRVLVAAIDSLQFLRVAEADSEVRRLWGHPRPYVRGRAVDYLIRMHPVSAAEFFYPAISDEAFVVRESAVDAVDDAAIDEELDPTPFLGVIWPLLDDPHHDVRAAAQGTLERHYWEERSRYFHERALHSRNPLRRASALRFLIDWDRGPSAELFRRGLSDAAPVVRIAALDQSHAAGCASKDVPDLTPFLNDLEPAVREAARVAIEGRVGLSFRE